MISVMSIMRRFLCLSHLKQVLAVIGKQTKVIQVLTVEVLVVVEDVVLEDLLVGVRLGTLGVVGAIKIVSQLHQHLPPSKYL